MITLLRPKVNTFTHSTFTKNFYLLATCWYSCNRLSSSLGRGWFETGVVLGVGHRVCAFNARGHTIRHHRTMICSQLTPIPQSIFTICSMPEVVVSKLIVKSKCVIATEDAEFQYSTVDDVALEMWSGRNGDTCSSFPVAAQLLHICRQFITAATVWCLYSLHLVPEVAQCLSPHTHTMVLW